MKKFLSTLKTYILLTVGTLTYVAAWTIFLIPNKIVGGGVSGVASLIFFGTGEGFPVSYTFFIINAVLLLLGMKSLGRDFGIKTVFSIIVATLAFKYLPVIYDKIDPDFISNLSENGPLTLAIFGGIVAGTGVGINFMQGGSTGGTDIVALMATKRYNLSPGKVIAYVDLFIIGSSFLIFQDITKVIYGYVQLGVMSFTLDWVISGSKQSVQIFIFSKKYSEIADKITTEANRGVSVLNATGWFTKEDNKVLMILARKYESNNIYRIIKSIDKDAFISVGSVMGVYGKGFEQIKTKKE
ncbi:MAG: YitT family protein [Prevotellaceae bacterium]|nr:YitT family protein [Prevotellaceae bacterium]